MSMDPQSVLNTVGAEGVRAWLVYFPSRSGKRGKEGDKRSKRMRRGAEKVKGVTVGEPTSLREWGPHRERKPREEAREKIRDFSLFGSYRKKVIHGPTV